MKATAELKAPFPYFGGKRRVAAEVWAALGDVDNYVEPFMGSLAVLLARPWRHDRKAETVNDADSYLSNFWRALSAAPEEVARWCDWPVNETDKLARELWLVNSGRERISRMEADPDFYDAKVAGWWVWGINQYIGGGFCYGRGPWVHSADGLSVVNRNDTGDAGQGVNRQRPHLGDAGQGVNRQRPSLGAEGMQTEKWNPDSLYAYFASLSARLRRVRVCCGDWKRVITDGALAFGDSVGVFLDPPYLGDVRTKDLYRVDDHSISDAVREWCIANGDNPRYRIVLAGYSAEHEAKMPRSWRMHVYKANAAYQTATSTGGNRDSRHGERLWYSPHCLCPQPELF